MKLLLSILLLSINNTGFGGPFYSFSKMPSYTPRNAILFLDSKGKTFAYIELCFDCNRHRLSSKKVNAGDFCNQKYEMPRVYFAMHGIDFGTQKISR